MVSCGLVLLAAGVGRRVVGGLWIWWVGGVLYSRGQGQGADKGK